MTETTQTYFEDMWIALEKQLAEYDSFTPSTSINVETNPSSGIFNNTQSSDFLAQSPTNSNTYESLLNLNTPEPTAQQLHSPNLQDRINAVRDIYNKQTTIIVAKMLDYSNKLNKLGKYSLSKKLATTIHQYSKNFSYSKDDDKYNKTFTYSVASSSPKTISVSINDKKSKNSINKQFENLEQALEFFYQDNYNI